MQRAGAGKPGRVSTVVDRFRYPSELAGYSPDDIAGIDTQRYIGVKEMWGMSLCSWRDDKGKPLPRAAIDAGMVISHSWGNRDVDGIVERNYRRGTWARGHKWLAARLGKSVQSVDSGIQALVRAGSLAVVVSG